jgi:hypothetical protein
MGRTTLLERQKLNLEKQQSRLSESIQRTTRMDTAEFSAALKENENFSWKRLKSNLVANESKLKEATAETAFGQLLRYGIQDFMFDAYKNVADFIYPDLVSVRSSKNRQEWYAPLFGVEVPSDIALGGRFEDSRVAGLDVEIVNKKVGRMFTVEREMIDDDQTGQIENRAQGLGGRLRYKEESDVLGVDVFTLTPLGRGITGVAGQSYTTALGNKPSAGFAALSQAGLESADISLCNMLDPMGNKILVKPTLLLVSPADKFNAAKLLNSVLQPSVPMTATFGSGSTQSAQFAGGGTGWTMTVNPLQGLYTLKVSRFLPAGYWYLMEPKTSIVWQERDGLELLMEARDAGMSFERDQYRWRIRRRYQTAVIEYRYIFCGNGQ